MSTDRPFKDWSATEALNYLVKRIPETVTKVVLRAELRQHSDVVPGGSPPEMLLGGFQEAGEALRFLAAFQFLTTLGFYAWRIEEQVGGGYTASCLTRKGAEWQSRGDLPTVIHAVAALCLYGNVMEVPA